MTKNINQIKEIARAIEAADKVCFFHHINPDGDTLSSSYALVEGLKKKYPKKEIKWIADRSFLERRFSFMNIDFSDTIEKLDDTWTVVVGDTSVLERIYGSEEFAKSKNQYCFDHHTNPINFDAKVFWHEPTWGASAIQSYLLAVELGIEFTPRVAMLHTFGILTDTNNFQYTLTDSGPLRAVADLFDNMIDKDLDVIYQAMKKRGPKDIALQKLSLNEYKMENGVSWLLVTDKFQKENNMLPEDCKRVNLLANMEGAEAWLFFIEDVANNKIKVEFRSFGAPMNKVATSFGGGGHIKASGCLLPFDHKEINKVIAATQEAVKGFKG